MEQSEASQVKKVILLLDVDCFSVQILTQAYPDLVDEHRPIVVLNSSVIASVSYEAKKFGISRKTKLEEAFEICPELQTFDPTVLNPEDPNKHDRFVVRNIIAVIREVASVLNLAENAIIIGSPDEIYVDVTQAANARLSRQYPTMQFESEREPKIYLECKNESKLLIRSDFSEPSHSELLFHGGIIAQEFCEKLYQDPRTRLKFSCGVSTNNLLAKLACRIRRPNSITVLTPEGLHRISEKIKIESIPGLSGKTGEDLQQKFNVQTMKELQAIPESSLLKEMGEKLSKQIIQLAFGTDAAVVSNAKASTRLYCRRKFNCDETTDVNSTIELLCKRMQTRLTEEMEWNNRRPLNMILSVKPGGIADLMLTFNSQTPSWEEINKEALRVIGSITYDVKLIAEISLYVRNFIQIT